MRPSGGRMEKEPVSLHERIWKLRNSFLARLPHIIADARRLSSLLAAAPDDHAAFEALFRVFHNLKGGVGVLGLRELRGETEALESLIARFQTPRIPVREASLEEALAEIERRLVTIEDLAAAAPKPEAGEFPQPPSARGETMLLPHAGQEPDQMPKKRIFLCEDDLAQAEALIEQLCCFGYEARAFADPESLRDAVMEAPPSAIIMDIIFPERPNAGTDMVAKLQRDLPSLPPVLFLSGRDDFEARLRAVQAGGDSYFVKPIKATKLADALDKLTRVQAPEPFRVLIIDDEPHVAAYHALVLEGAGMITRHLSEPAGILEMLDDFNPDLVLMDMHMPRCSGRDLACLIRQLPEFVSLPIVFLSGEIDRFVQMSALRAGADGFLTKPIQPDDLVSAVVVRALRIRTLRNLMARDGLTGLFNHTFVTQLLLNAVASAARSGIGLCVAMIDVDMFKALNDGYGHPAGDQVLATLAQLFQQRLRSADVVGRYGGEEFLVILDNTLPDQGMNIIEELRQSFAAVRFHFGKEQASSTFSAGVACFPFFGSAEELIAAADAALYDAKRQGRNRVVAARGVPLSAASRS